MGNAESASADELNTTKGSGETRGSLTKFITSSENKPDWSAYDAALPEGEFVLESVEGQARLEALKSSVSDEVRSKFPDLVDFICSASLRYRNGDLPTANDRVQNYLRWRMEYLGGLEEQSLVHDAELLETLNMNIFNIIENVDAQGRSLLWLQLRNVDPTKITPLRVLRAFHYLVIGALRRNPSVQKYGLIMCSDMGDASFANTDTRIPKAIMGAISKNLPLRLHLIALCRPMWLVYILFPIVRLFLAKKLQDRIHNIGGDATLLGKAPFLLKMDVLPARLSGSNFAYNHQEKVAQWKADEEQRIANHPDEKAAEGK